MDKFPEAFNRYEKSPDYPKDNPTLAKHLQQFQIWQNRRLSYLQERALKEAIEPELIQRRTFVIIYMKQKWGIQKAYRDKKTQRFTRI